VIDTVILVVYGWKSVQPGTLSWVFPSVAAAAHAAHAMSNAAKWAIVTGSLRASHDAAADLESARATGSVLLEEVG
jgi:hypothetical protein